jgi:hypothetical protein
MNRLPQDLVFSPESWRYSLSPKQRADLSLPGEAALIAASPNGRNNRTFKHGRAKYEELTGK